MQRNFSRLGDEEFDLLIIGGGITGATLAWDTTLRGLKVALVERADFGSATSAATSKLIHGGLRYLKNGDFRLVNESLRERRILLSIAPHLVRPLPFLVPAYKKRGPRKWVLKAGLTIYDFLSWSRGKNTNVDEGYLPGHRMLSKDRTLRLEPGLKPDGLKAGALYSDCLCNPDRLTFEFLIGAYERGAVLVNYAPLKELILDQGRVKGALAEDGFTGQRVEIQARMTINTTGPWADEIDQLCGVGQGVVVRRSKGIHIVTRPVAGENALVLMTQAGRHFFIIPWRAHSLIGTTDTEYTGDPSRLSIQDDEVKAFLSEINEAYPSAKLTEQDIVYRYAGIRPLVEQDTNVYKASRRYEIVDHHQSGQAKGYISVVGGKYTTSRSLACKLADKIVSHLGCRSKSCMTASEKLPGTPSQPMALYLRSCLEQEGSKAPRDLIEHLVWTYGTRHTRILELLEKDPDLGERIALNRPEIYAETVYAIKNEMAQTLCDVMFRRTGIGTLGRIADDSLERILRLSASLLGWSKEKTALEKQNYINKSMGLTENLTPPAGAAGEY